MLLKLLFVVVFDIAVEQLNKSLNHTMRFLCGSMTPL